MGVLALYAALITISANKVYVFVCVCVCILGYHVKEESAEFFYQSLKLILNIEIENWK